MQLQTLSQKCMCVHTMQKKNKSLYIIALKIHQFLTLNSSKILNNPFLQLMKPNSSIYAPYTTHVYVLHILCLVLCIIRFITSIRKRTCTNKAIIPRNCFNAKTYGFLGKSLNCTRYELNCSLRISVLPTHSPITQRNRLLTKSDQQEIEIFLKGRMI